MKLRPQDIDENGSGVMAFTVKDLTEEMPPCEFIKRVSKESVGWGSAGSAGWGSASSVKYL